MVYIQDQNKLPTLSSQAPTLVLTHGKGLGLQNRHLPSHQNGYHGRQESVSHLSQRREYLRETRDNQSLMQILPHEDTWTKNVRPSPSHLSVAPLPPLEESVRGRKKLLPDTIRKCWYNSMIRKNIEKERESFPYHNQKFPMHKPINYVQPINR